MVNDETGFIHFSITSFVIKFISYITRLCWNSIQYYLLFVVKFVVQVVWIPMAMFLVCPSLLHWLQITSVFLPSLAFSYLVDCSNNFQYSLVSPILSSQVISTSLNLNKVSLFIPVVAIRRYGYEHAQKIVVNKLHLFDVKGNLLVLVYVHIIYFHLLVSTLLHHS